MSRWRLSLSLSCGYCSSAPSTKETTSVALVDFVPARSAKLVSSSANKTEQLDESLTMLRVTPRATDRMEMVTTSWILLNVGLSTSKEREGDVRVPKKSKPVARSSDSDSSRPGNESTRDISRS